MRPETVEWLRQAEYDINTAKAMYDTGRYIYTAFMCQLSIEKFIKGLIVERTGHTPPKTHNLIKLVKTANLELSKSQLEFIGTLNMAGVGARYPDMLDDAIKHYPKEVVWNYLTKTEEVMQWLRQQIKST